MSQDSLTKYCNDVSKRFCSRRFSCAEIAHIVRNILNFDVGAKVSTYEPGFCCQPSAFVRRWYSVVFPSLSLFTLNEKQVFMTLQPSGMSLVWTISHVPMPAAKDLDHPFVHNCYPFSFMRSTKHCIVVLRRWSDPREFISCVLTHHCTHGEAHGCTCVSCVCLETSQLALLAFHLLFDGVAQPIALAEWLHLAVQAPRARSVLNLNFWCTDHVTPLSGQ